jgi:biopolymer transport protein ExbB
MKTRAKVSTFLAAVLFALTASMTTAPVFAQEPSASATAAAPAASAPEAAAPAVDAPAAEPVKPAAADDQYSFAHLVKEGNLVDRATLAIMLLMSMGSWYILITKIVDLAKLGGQSKEARKFWKAANVNAGMSSLKEGSPYRFIAESGVNASEHHEGALLEQIDLNSWVTMSIQRSIDKVQSRLSEGLTFLATVGSTAPFIGLFGTVMGIYQALIAIGTSGQSSIDKVAGPVGSALIMTAFGLFVAVPAVLGYNYLLRRNKSAMEDIRAFGADLHSVVLSGAMSKASGSK